MSSATRDRILDEAMRLFGEHGYRGTTITKIEAAAGLTPGAGGIYHHFKSKDAVLAAGIERHLARLAALRDIRRLLTPLGDLHAELTLTARYILAELDHEAELLKILASEARNRPHILCEAVEQLIDTTFAGFAAWISERATPHVKPTDAAAIAAVGLGSLFSSRLLGHVLGVPPRVDDERLIRAWVELMTSAIGGDGAPGRQP
ncbi:MAG: TetR/AcrR family transcriptional regulator [Solirubrobacterales bacterium]|nr:TetR/AcrR family transcriptional regulator [Solirubrobacterales bacterium]MBV9716907.1 TetR/AcrR family transcriptional regulator [Solirubrobacterales bacterium]